MCFFFSYQLCFSLQPPKQNSNLSLYEPTNNENLILITLSSIKDSDMAAQMCRLTKVFTADIHKVWIDQNKPLAPLDICQYGR